MPIGRLNARACDSVRPGTSGSQKLTVKFHPTLCLRTLISFEDEIPNILITSHLASPSKSHHPLKSSRKEEVSKTGTLRGQTTFKP